MRRVAPVLAALVALTVVGAACSSSGSPKSTPPPSAASGTGSPSGAATTAPSVATSSAATASSAGSSAGLYVSLGDSYAAGYQPSGPGKGSTTTNGFAYQVVTQAKAKGRALTLVNFACAGATTTSIVKTVGCRKDLLGPGGTAYPTQTQAAAAEAYLTAHQGQVALVTVSIGGNDVTACGASADPIPCLTKALAVVRTNLTTLLTGLRAAAGPSTQIVGITYPDVLLGNYLSKDPQVKNLATLSSLAFKQFINPTLKAAYTAAGGQFVDVTAATGGYGSLSQTTSLPGYGTVPVPVAKVCQLTFYCQYRDIHPRTDGYALIADLVTATLR